MLRNICLSLVLVSLCVLSSCSTGGIADPGDIVVSSTAETGNRLFMGNYTVELNPDNLSASIIPNRAINDHMNATGYLSGWPCGNCLKVKNIDFLSGNIVECDIEVTHPISNPIFTVMDLRVIAIFPANEYTNSIGYSYALVNRDGMTTLWDNTSIPGHINGYKAYNKTEPRRPFGPGDIFTEHFIVKLPPGGLNFSIAVDASWVPNDGVNYPDEMNSLEVIDMTGNVDGSLSTTGGLVKLTVQAYDYQLTFAINHVMAYCDDLFYAPKSMETEFTNGHNYRFGLNISNEKLAPSGLYNVLIQITDNQDPYYPYDVSSYMIVPVLVELKNIYVSLRDADYYKTPGNYYKFYSYAGPADRNVVDYLDTNGWWDFTQISYPSSCVRKILPKNDPNVAGFAADFPDADRFVMHWGNYGLFEGTFFTAEDYSYTNPQHYLYEHGFHEFEHFGGSVLFDYPSGAKYPIDKNSYFTRSGRAGEFYFHWITQSMGIGHCVIPLNGTYARDALMIRTIASFSTSVPILKAIIYEWYDTDGNLLATIYSTNLTGLPPNWNESTNEITYGAIIAMYESHRQ